MQTSSRDFYASGKLGERVSTAVNMLADCHLCPRKCGVNRLQDERGFCATGESAYIGSFGAHYGEEQPLVAPTGGAIDMSLSFRITISRLFMAPALFIAS